MLVLTNRSLFQMSKLDTLAPISAACAVTAAVMYPVDVVRALKMASATGPGYTMKQFVKSHGIVGVMSQGVVCFFLLIGIVNLPF